MYTNRIADNAFCERWLRGSIEIDRKNFPQIRICDFCGFSLRERKVAEFSSLFRAT